MKNDVGGLIFCISTVKFSVIVNSSLEALVALVSCAKVILFHLFVCNCYGSFKQNDEGVVFERFYCGV